MEEITCAFCKGKGVDPFNLLSKLATCQVCGGTGKVKIEKPMIKCAYCKGTGIYPHNGRVTCTVCNGKGMVTVKGDINPCSECEGTGQAIESGLPCIKCTGKGFVRKGG
jgi:DnaJ-class molecular chaperone